VIRIKRVYEPYAEEDGKRVLVDRLWPRGLNKEDARIDLWLRDIAPSTALRKWFAHDPSRWGDFRRNYRKELEAHKEMLDELRKASRKDTVTLLFSARDSAHNNAVVLKEAIGEAGKPKKGMPHVPHPE
jgi:uncharacterized protein YeaO (DUF488 family)